MKTINPYWLRIFLIGLIVSSGIVVPVKAQTTGGTLTYNTPQMFPTVSSLFYYNSLPSHAGSNAVLMAATANSAESERSVVLYETLDQTIYGVGYEDSIYLSPSLEELLALVPGEIDTALTISVTVQGREPDATNFLALYFSQIQDDVGDKRIIYMEGIGTSMILDIDPSMRRTLEIPNLQVFSLITTSGGCDSNPNFYQLTIAY